MPKFVIIFLFLFTLSKLELPLYKSVQRKFQQLFALQSQWQPIDFREQLKQVPVAILLMNFLYLSKMKQPLNRKNQL